MRKKYFPFFIFILVSLFAISCNKEETPPVIPPDNPDPIDTIYKQYGTPFSSMAKLDDMVLYEVNLRAFSSGGKIQGVIDRLDALKALGVNVVWLMPIHPIGQIKSVNSPYSVKNFKEVSTEYGSLDQLRNLTDEAHKRGMAVIMDWVANHTAWDNPWISNKSWYTQDGNGNIVHPPGTNWLDVADLNYTNADMRLAMIGAMKYWVLEANVDGYRCDHADGVPADFWEQAFDTLHQIPGRDYIFLAEGNRTDHFTSGFDMIYAWDFYYKMKDVFKNQPATGLFTTHQAELSNVPEGKQKLRYSTNHDESAWEGTPVEFFGGIDGALSASVSTIFMGGVPLFYTGQEVGRMEKVPFFSNSPINWNSNPGMLQAYKDMMAFYSQSKAARTGLVTDYSVNNVVCFKKELNDEEILIISNVRANQLNFNTPDPFQNTQWTNALTNEAVEIGLSIPLAGFQYLILKK